MRREDVRAFISDTVYGFAYHVALQFREKKGDNFI